MKQEGTCRAAGGPALDLGASAWMVLRLVLRHRDRNQHRKQNCLLFMETSTCVSFKTVKGHARKRTHQIYDGVYFKGGSPGSSDG